MRVTTKSAIDISESLASFLLASRIYNNIGCDPVFEKRMSHVDTAKYTIADVFVPTDNVAFEVKSIEHGTSALKGVVQSSIYLEQASESVLVMQKPKRTNLVDGIESFSRALNVGVLWIVGIPKMCSERMIKKATRGTTKPFELWKENRYSHTKKAIIQRSNTDWIDEYIQTLEQVVEEKGDEIFKFAVQPERNGNGFSDIY